MGPRLCLLLGLLAAFLLLIDVSGKDQQLSDQHAEVATKTAAAGEEDAKYGGGGYPGGGYPGRGGGGYPGGGGGGYPGGGYPGGGGGYPGGRGGRGGGGGGGCRYGCCGRGYYNRGCRCCRYAGEAVSTDAADQP